MVTSLLGNSLTTNCLFLLQNQKWPESLNDKVTYWSVRQLKRWSAMGKPRWWLWYFQVWWTNYLLSPSYSKLPGGTLPGAKRELTCCPVRRKMAACIKHWTRNIHLASFDSNIWSAWGKDSLVLYSTFFVRWLRERGVRLFDYCNPTLSALVPMQQLFMAQI